MADALPPPLSSRVYDEVLGRIISGRVKPGDAFNRRQVAAELGVSVAPVLEAMLELEAEGLIQTSPRRGTRVRIPSLGDVWGQLIVREGLECQAARLYCGKPVRRHYARLIRLASELDGTDVRSITYAREEIRFHHYLVSLAGCPPLVEALDRVMKVGVLHAAITLQAEPGPDVAVGHVALIEALLTADPETAEAAVRAHIRAGKSALYADHSADETDFPSLPAWLADEAAE